MSKRYQALIQERADLVAEARTLFSRAEAESRDLTEEERKRDDEIAARLETLADEISREERRREWERTVQPVQDANAQAARVSGMRERIEDDPRRGFRDVAEFALAVKDLYTPGGRVDERLRIGAAPTDFHRETGSDEGRMVPPAFRQEIWEVAIEEDSLLPMVDSEPTSANSVEFLKDETTPWGATGIVAKWRSEATQMTPTRLVTEGEQMRLHDLYAFVTATDQLLSDAARLAARLTRKAGLAIRWKINEAIINGTGVGQPLGWMKSGALVSVAKESGQTAATIVAANVAKMYSRVLNPAQAIWLINQDVLPEFLTMTLGDKPIWIPPSESFRNAPGGILFGRPVLINEHAETLGTKGDIQLVNPRGYYAITSEGGVQFASSMHLFFDYGLQAFRWTFRLNGQPFLSKPVSPAKGSATRSHFVVLDTRS